MTDTLGKLLDLLDLEQIELDIFRGRSPSDRRQRVFGGQVAGQALVAAGRTVPADRPVHSLHAYFIRPGDPSVPLVYIVDRVRDGRSFTTRRVSAIQHGKVIFTLSASFHHAEPGPDHSAAMPEAPPPESVPTHPERLEKAFGPDAAKYFRENPIDLRVVGPLSVEAQRDPSLRTDRNLVWLRADGELPDDPLLHVCLMTYASDMTLLDSVLLRHGLSWADGSTTGASLDHAMWFHRPFRADRWLLYSQESPSAAGARGLARGEVFQDGRLVVSVMQEGLIRSRRPDPTPPLTPRRLPRPRPPPTPPPLATLITDDCPARVQGNRRSRQRWPASWVVQMARGPLIHRPTLASSKPRKDAPGAWGTSCAVPVTTVDQRRPPSAEANSW